MADNLTLGLDALKSGNKTKARQLLAQVVKDDPRNPVGWLWLSYAVDDVTQKRDCLKRVLAISPQSVEAREQLEAIDRLDGVAAPPFPRQPPESKVQASFPSSQQIVVGESQASSLAQQPIVSAGKAPPRKANGVLFLLLLILVASVACVGLFIVNLRSSSTGSSSAPTSSESLEYMLAVLDAGGYVSRDDVTIARFRYLLKTLETKTGNSQQFIADTTVRGKELAHNKYGRQYKLIELMEAANQAIPDNPQTKVSYDTVLYALIATAK